MSARRVGTLTAGSALLLGSSVYFLFLHEGGGRASQPDDHDRLLDTVVSHIDQRPRSLFQAELLADGTLTETEYDLAFERYSSCVQAVGAEIAGPGTKTKLGVYDFYVMVPALSEGEPNRDVQHAAAECEAAYFDVVGPRWSAMRMPTRDAVDGEMAKVPACMSAAGLEAPEPFSAEAILRFLESARQEDAEVLVGCLKEASAAIGVPSDISLLP